MDALLPPEPPAAALPTARGPLLRLRTSAAVLRDPIGHYRESVARHGPIYRSRAVNGDIVVVPSADLAREVFALPPEATGPFGARALLGPGSLFLLGGARDQRERRLLTRPSDGGHRRGHPRARRAAGRGVARAARSSRWTSGSA